MLEWGGDFSVGSGTNRPGRETEGEHRICRECGALFATVQALRAHRAVAHGAKWYRCAECGKRMRGYPAMQRHRMERHRLRDRRLGVVQKKPRRQNRS